MREFNEFGLWDEEDEEDYSSADLYCWSCGKAMTYEQHGDNDGFCPYCDSEIGLDE